MLAKLQRELKQQGSDVAQASWPVQRGPEARDTAELTLGWAGQEAYPT